MRPVDREEFDRGRRLDRLRRARPRPSRRIRSRACCAGEVDPAAFEGQDRGRGRRGAVTAGCALDLGRRRPDARRPRFRRTRSPPCSTTCRCAPHRRRSRLLIVALLGFLAPCRRAARAAAGNARRSQSPPRASTWSRRSSPSTQAPSSPSSTCSLALLVGAVCTLGFHYLMAAFERQRVRDTFSRFVPAEVVDQLLAEGDGDMQPRRRAPRVHDDLHATSAASPPTRRPSPPTRWSRCSTATSARWSTPMMDNGGTLVSYLGDGIMAVFGAPLVAARPR